MFFDAMYLKLLVSYFSFQNSFALELYVLPKRRASPHPSFCPPLQRTIDAHLQTQRPAPAALRWIQNADGVLKRWAYFPPSFSLFSVFLTVALLSSITSLP